MSRTDNNPPAKWTVMIYMAANDDTSNEASLDFQKELLWIGQMLDENPDSPQVNILLLIYQDWDTNKTKADYRARLYKVQMGFLANPIKIFNSDVSMGDSETLTGFIKYCKVKHPAEKYMLLLWGHGTGSGMFQPEIEEMNDKILEKYPDFQLSIATTNAPISLKELINGQHQLFTNGITEARVNIRYRNGNNREVVDTITVTKNLIRRFRNKPKYFLRSNNPETLKKLTSHITSKPNLDALVGRELNKSLKNSFGNNGKLDLLVIMGCCMQLMETGFEIKQHCRYYSASEELMFFEGYNYFDTFSKLIEHPGMDAAELGKLFITDTPLKEDKEKKRKKLVFNSKDRGEIAISCVNLEKNNRLFENISQIAEDLLQNFEELKQLIRNARSRCSHFGETAYEFSFIDLAWFLTILQQNLSKTGNHRRLSNKIDSTIQFIKNEYILKSFIGNDCSKQLKRKPSPGGHGLAIYFPKSKTDHENDEERGWYFDKGYRDYVNTFSTENKWNDLLVKYMEFVP
jgi:hypothetical protein